MIAFFCQVRNLSSCLGFFVLVLTSALSRTPFGAPDFADSLGCMLSVPSTLCGRALDINIIILSYLEGEIKYYFYFF